MHIVFVDNQDSFVYNLVDLITTLGHTCTVFRNTVSPAEILGAGGDAIILSPGPGHPRDAGCLMQVLDSAYGSVPIIGVCLGFQALLLHQGLNVRPCGPVQGKTDHMAISNVSRETNRIFDGCLTRHGTVAVARYHSLGVPAKELPATVHNLGTCPSEIGDISMAASFHAANEDRPPLAFGVQFHPESILTPHGPSIFSNIIQYITQKD